ncbi:MAG: DNA recombination protein RmuC [Bacilli bacterium]|jgi:DNA recombination protein RmuC|nr:DNA recombination protein RmuC [Bacilli bacterium]
MELTLLIISLVVCAMTLGFCVYLLVTVKKASKGLDGDKSSSDAIVGLSTNLQSLHNDVISVKTDVSNFDKSVPLLISNELGKQMLIVQKQLGDQADQNNNRLAGFQKNVSESIAQSTALTNKALSDSIAAINKKVDENFVAINKQVNDSLTSGFKSTSDTMGNLKETLGKMTQAQANLEKLQSDVVSLNNVLTGSQSRGQYGEMQLQMILEATWPNGKGTFYDEQYFIKKAKDGSDIRPDAVVFFPRQHAFICIDSKFPLTHYAKMFGGEKLSDEEMAVEKALFKKDVKAKFNEVAAKYIIPNVTTQQAVIFIPNDGVFAYIHSEFKDIVEDGMRKNVVMASPSILQPILVTFHATQIDADRAANLGEMKQELASLAKDFQIFGDKWSRLHDNVDRLQNNALDVDKTIKRMGSKFNSISNAEGAEVIDNEDKLAINAPSGGDAK